MPVPRCLITGCRLRDIAGYRYVWGDLHSCGSALVFNAVLDERGEAAWELSPWPATDDAERPAVTISAAFPYFERRGVIVFDKWHAQFNQLADERMR